MKVSGGLIVALAALGVSSVLAWADPWAREDVGAVMVSNRSAARRLFPGLGELSAEGAKFEFQTPQGARIRLQPVPEGGHVVFDGDRLLGPADPEAIGGIWSSLRMATTLRAVSPGVDIGREQGGVVRVGVGDQNLVLILGREAPDKSGLYGVLEHEGEEAWVVEEELSWLVTQPAQNWLSRRLVDVELESLRGLAWGAQLSLVRGGDGNWRSEGETPALLSTQAVELRLDRLLNTRLDPMISRDELAEFSAKPWLLLNLESGAVRNFAVGGLCPEHPKRRVVDRGPGLLGCVDAELVAPWDLEDKGVPLIEGRLVPLAYANLVAVNMRAPVRRSLRRRTGGWLLDEEGKTSEVVDDEAYRWFNGFSATRLDAGVEARPREELDTLRARVDLSFVVGPEIEIGVACGRDDEKRWWCSRDGGALRALLRPPRDLVFDAETFEDRGVLRFAPADVRALELAGGSSGRQSLRRDLGAWRLDAPTHPDGDGAIDQVRVESLLANLGSLRSESWVDADVLPLGEPLRELRVDIAPAQGEARAVLLRVFEGCVGQLDERRLFRVSEQVCEVLMGDLLYDDPLRNWLLTANALQVRRAGTEGGTRSLERQSGVWVDASGAALAPELAGALLRWSELRSTAVVSGTPTGEAQWSLEFEREGLAPAGVQIGDGWAQLQDADWYYQLHLPSP